MAAGRILVSDAGIRIEQLEVHRKDVADFLRRHEEVEHEQMLVQAIEVGVFCLERATSRQDTEFVRRQVESLVTTVENKVGAIPQQVEAALLAKVGIEDGQVLAPIKTLVRLVVTEATNHLNEVKQIVRDVDPRIDGTVVGSALRQVRDMLDPNRTDSLQKTLDQSIREVTTADGMLARQVKSTVEQALNPLKERVDELAKEIRGDEAAAAALEQTAAKGTPYEEEVLGKLVAWAARVGGVSTRHCGPDNQPGDVVLEILPSSVAATGFRLVVEARDRQQPKGHKAISEDLRAAMAERQASAAIYVSHYLDGLANEVGEWAEGQCETGPYVACVHENLELAVRFLIVERQLAERRAASYEIDPAAVATKLRQIRNALVRVKTINRKVTDVEQSALAIRTEADSLRDEVRDALAAIEDAVRLAPTVDEIPADVGLGNSGEGAEEGTGS